MSFDLVKTISAYSWQLLNSVFLITQEKYKLNLQITPFYTLTTELFISTIFYWLIYICVLTAVLATPQKTLFQSKILLPLYKN